MNPNFIHSGEDFYQASTRQKNLQSIGFTLDDFAALLDKYDYHFSPGDIVAGTVFSIESRGALIDIGARTAAYIPIQEMSINRVDDPDEVLQPNEIREFFILTDENEDGQLTLSIRRIESIRAWERVRQLQAEDATIRSNVFATNRGGALVRIEGLRGFIPKSHISTWEAKEDLLGEDLPLKFLEVDEERNRLVLSHRRALVESKMNGLEVGQVVIGSVRGIKPYGAFIDIGGVSGLLHISEISHDHIDTPSSVFEVNDELKVMILDLDAERGRISLSTKQLEPEAGAMLKNRELVYEKAEEMAEKYRQKLLAETESRPIEEEILNTPPSLENAEEIAQKYCRKPIYDVYIDDLSNSNSQIRLGAALILGEMGCEDAVPALCNILLTDQMPEVRRMAAKSLGMIGSEETGL
jgi:small subunit ribosomal protein S1